MVKSMDLKMKIKTLALLLLGVLTTGCSTLSPDQQAKVNDMSSCEKLTTLVDASSSGFSVLKGVQVGAKLIKTWQAKAHLVGNSCQIIESSKGKTIYTCQEQFEDYQSAVKIHQYAQSMVTQCLGSNWMVSSQENGEVLHTDITSASTTSAISIALGKGLDKQSPWVVSLEISDK